MFLSPDARQFIARSGFFIGVMLASGAATAASFTSFAGCAVGIGYGNGSVVDECTPIERSSDTGLMANQVLSTSFFYVDDNVATKYTRDYHASVRSGPGDLGGSVKASLSGIAGWPPVYMGGSALAYATYTDSILLTSSTLAEGTPVTVDFNQVLNFSMKRDNPQNVGGSQMFVALGFTATGLDTVEFTTCLGNFYPDCNAPVDVDGSPQSFNYGVSVQSYVGGSITISAALAVGTFTEMTLGEVFPMGDTYIPKTVTSTVDSLHSAHTYITTSTEGVNFIAESGHDYSPSAVPEPASAVLLVAGLAGIALARRRAAITFGEGRRST